MPTSGTQFAIAGSGHPVTINRVCIRQTHKIRTDGADLAACVRCERHLLIAWASPPPEASQNSKEINHGRIRLEGSPTLPWGSAALRVD